MSRSNLPGCFQPKQAEKVVQTPQKNGFLRYFSLSAPPALFGSATEIKSHFRIIMVEKSNS